MNEIKVKKVENKHELKDFLSVPKKIYANCSQYVPDLESDIVDSFNPKKNAGLSFCDLQPFIAYKGNEAVGRIVGIVNHKANTRWNTKTVRFSLIEFIDDLQVSTALLKTVEEWGRTMGMNHMQGPMGITDFDKEGMLVENFEMIGSTTAIYNPPYYPQHLEKLGFQKEVDWVQIRVQIPEEVPAKYARVADYCRTMLGLTVKKVNSKDLLDHYGQEIFDLLNESYSELFGFSSLSKDQIEEFVKLYVKIVDLNMVPLVINDKGELVGVAVTMPSLAEAMHKTHGSMWPFGWYHLLKALKWKKPDHVDLLLIAVRKDLRGMGVNALFFDDLIPIFNKNGFKWAETGPQLETNAPELAQWKPMHPETVKRRRCYCKNI
ncbi:MAG: N-acetyltransferase [Prevotella sp.]|nr:N-acetyltransferase [Prevotella sp.]MBP3842540.1 N-acetyltransferase [Prevotella sp.]